MVYALFGLLFFSVCHGMSYENVCKVNAAIAGDKAAEIAQLLDRSSVAQDQMNDFLGLACAHNNEYLLHFFLTRGAQVNALDADGKTPLYWALVNGHTNMAELLFARGADVNKLMPDRPDIVTPGEQTTVFNRLTKSEWKKKSAQWLLTHGALIDPRDSNGRTPFHTVSANAQIEAILFFSSKGANVKTVDSNGATPLHELCRFEKPSIAKLQALYLLIRHFNVDVDKQDRHGQTALFEACKQWLDADPETVHYLLFCKADPKICPKENSSLIACTRDRNIRKMLSEPAPTTISKAMQSAIDTINFNT